MLGQNPKVAKQEKKKMGWAKSICTITRALSILCPPLHIDRHTYLLLSFSH